MLSKSRFFKSILLVVTLFTTCFVYSVSASETGFFSKSNSNELFQIGENLSSKPNASYYDCKSVYACEDYYIPLQCNGSNGFLRVLCPKMVRENCRRYYGVPPDQC